MSESEKQLLVVYGSVKAAEAAIASTSQRLLARDIAKEAGL